MTKHGLSEGNRRITALKLLNNPNLCKDNLIRKKIEKIVKLSIQVIPKYIDGTTHDDYNIMMKFVAARHLGQDDGRGVKPWGAREQQVLSEIMGKKGNYPLSSQVLKIYESSGNKVTSDFVSTLERLLGSKDFRSKIGLRRKDEILSFTHDDKEVLPLLFKIIKMLNDKIINVDTVKTKEKTDNFINNEFYGDKYKQTKPTTKLDAPLALENYELINTNQSVSKITTEVIVPKKITLKKPANKIAPSNEIVEKLNELASDKFIALYQSLCTISLKTHPQLVYVGAWSFFESLAARMGKNDGTSFHSFLNGKIKNEWGFNKDEKSSCDNKLKDIMEKGNLTKHSGKSAPYDACQLKNDFEVLEQVIIKCLETIIDKKT